MAEMKINKKLLILAVVLFALFIVFTVLAATYDRGPIGADGSAVGFSHLNNAFHQRFGYRSSFYKITQYLGYICLMLAAMNATVACLDLVRTKSLKKMDRDYLVTMILYAAVVILYIFFEKVVINVRPTEAEASYPSSHTMLALTVFYSQTVLLKKMQKKEKGTRIALSVICYLAMAAMVVLRLFSGVHWLTDIYAAVLLSVSLLIGYRAFIK